MSKLPTDKQLCPLHSHTVYSVLDGASDIDEYIQWCKNRGAPGLAVTDHGWMIGALEVHQKAQKAGLVGIPGVEFYVAPDVNYKFKGKAYDYYHVTAWAVSEVGYRNLMKLGSISFDKGEIQTVKAVKKDNQWLNVDGFHKRVVKKFAQSKPRITFDELLENHEGLVIGSGCLIGAINKALLAGERDGAENNLLRLLDVFRGRMFVEIMPHNCTHDWNRDTKTFQPNECTDFSPDGDLQKACNLENIEIARKNKLPLIMTVDSHFVRPDQKALQDMLLQNGDEDGWHFYNSYHMMDTEEAWQHWKDHYGESREMTNIFVEAVENNHQLVELAKGIKVKDPYHLPEISIPEEIRSGNTAEDLKVMIMTAIERHGRMKWDNPEWTARLEKEISVICDNGEQDFSQYFLFLEQWGEWTREHSVLSAPGRGSGAGSLLCYLLKITHLDPFRFKLPFERFLSPGRIKRKKWPDIDWDMGDRGPLLAKLSEVYGDKFAQCSTHGKLKVRSSVKDAHRIIVIRPLEESYSMAPASEKDKIAKKIEEARVEVEEVTKSIKNTPQGVDDRDFLIGYTDQEGNINPGHLEQNDLLVSFFDRFKSEDPSKDMKSIVLQMLGVPRSVGRHASAYFVSDEPIWHSVPTCDISGHVCTQYTTEQDNNYAEKAGLIKFDFLGVNTLLDISNCIRMVQKSYGYKTWQERLTINGEEFLIWKGELPVDKVPSKDGKTILEVYDLPESEEVFNQLSEGNTSSLFQVSTPLLTEFCKRVQPDKIDDLSAIVALCRPGPLDAVIEDGCTTMSNAFIMRRNGQMPVTYVHPGMEEVLRDTYGVAVYQEQLQQMFQDLAGYSAEEADYIRELVGKKKKQDMEKIIPDLRERLAVRGWTEEQAQVFINLCISSARYSFNRAHSASYGYVAYMSAFLKTHYPKEWWTAVLQNSKVEEIRDKGYARELREMLVLPHINGPMESFESREDGRVHSPMWLVKGVGEIACKAIQQSRGESDFKSMQDFFERIDKRAVNEGIFKKLIISGAFSLIEPGKTARDLFKEYLFLKKAVGLKSYGAGKTGEALKVATEKLIKDRGDSIRDIQEALSDFPSDDLSLQTSRTSMLPIYTMDVHSDFYDLLSRHITYSINEESRSVGTVRGSDRDGSHRLANVFIDLEAIADNYPRLSGREEVAWVGLLDEKAEFRYLDKKTQKQVSALKMKVVNAGDSVECIIWPNLRDLMKKSGIQEPTGSKILICVGSPKPGKVSGQWSLSVNRLIEV